MSCDLTKGRAQACKSVGGLKHIELANWNGGGATLSGTGTISALGTATTFYKYDLRGANNSVDEAGETSRDNNTTFQSITGSIQLPYQEDETRQELEVLSKTRCFLITEDYNGVRKFYGLADGVDVAVNTNSGAGMGDFNGYTLNVSGVSPELAHILEPIVTNLSLSATQVTPN